MEIAEVDGRTAELAVLERLARAESEALAELADGAPPPTVFERVARYRSPGSALLGQWIALAEDDVAGTAFLRSHGGDIVLGEVRVRPAHRRRGIGSALFERLTVEARARGITSFFGHHGSAAGAAFARHVGARDDQRDVKSVLLLREVDLAQPHVPAGVELRSWEGPVPDELVASFVAARSAMVDAPAPGGHAGAAWSVERQREDERTIAGRGFAQHVTVAVYAGEVLALTAVRVGATSFAVTDDTVTIPAARGRGLATAVKLENLRVLRAARPDVGLVGTMNAEHNTAMRRVNAKLGFVPAVTLTTAVVTL